MSRKHNLRDITPFTSVICFNASKRTFIIFSGLALMGVINGVLKLVYLVITRLPYMYLKLFAIPSPHSKCFEIVFNC